MAFRKIRYLIEKPGRHGTLRYFWQPSVQLRVAGWQPVRLPDAPAAALAEAERLNAQLDAWRKGAPIEDANTPFRAPRRTSPTRKRAAPGSIAALIHDYQASRFWQNLALDTRSSYQANLDLISAWAGDAPVRAITPVAVQSFHDHLAAKKITGPDGKPRRIETPARAAATVRVLRLLLTNARRLGYLSASDGNAASRPGLIGTTSTARLWSADAVSAFVAMADHLQWSSIGTAVMLDEWLGQRQRDVLSLAQPAVAGTRITLRQSKTGAVVALPIHLVPPLQARLQAELDRAQTRAPHATTLLVCEATGRAWKRDHFRHIFQDIRTAAIAGAADAGLLPCPDLAGLQFRWLRHTAVTRLAEAGCTIPEIASISGHTLTAVEQILQRYLVRTASLAEAAFRKRLAAEADTI